MLRGWLQSASRKASGFPWEAECVTTTAQQACCRGVRGAGLWQSLLLPLCCGSSRCRGEAGGKHCSLVCYFYPPVFIFQFPQSIPKAPAAEVAGHRVGPEGAGVVWKWTPARTTAGFSEGGSYTSAGSGLSRVTCVCVCVRTEVSLPHLQYGCWSISALLQM